MIFSEEKINQEKINQEKINQEKIISERINKSPNIENTNQKLFLEGK